MYNMTNVYEPELFDLLVDAIPRLRKSKRDVMTLFRDAGVPTSLTSDLAQALRVDRNSISKYAIVRTVLDRLNDAGDVAKEPRKRILDFVVSFEQFDTTWESDRLEAIGAVTKVREHVQKRSYVSEVTLQQERQREDQRLRDEQRLHEERQAREWKEQMTGIREDFYQLFALEPRKRGKQLENVMNALFRAHHILVKEDFVVTGEPGEGVTEQIDGVIDIDGHLYLAEMKWLQRPVGRPEAGQHISRVLTRDCRGLLISHSGYTAGAINECKNAQGHAAIVLVTLQEIFELLQADVCADLVTFLKDKIHGTILHRQPLYKISDYSRYLPKT